MLLYSLQKYSEQRKVSEPKKDAGKNKTQQDSEHGETVNKPWYKRF